MKKNLIVKHNDFIEAKYNLTLTELKIIAKLSSMIKKDDDDFKVYKFTANELMEDLKLNNNYDDLKEAIEKGYLGGKNKKLSSRACIYALHLLNICKDIFEPA